jgi:hypothetical protein
MHDAGKPASGWHALTHPPGRFLRMAVVQGGVLDGWRGILLAWLAARGVARKYRLLARPPRA